MQNARWQRDNLLDYGWEYVVVDIRWYCDHPSLGGGWYNQKGTQGYVLDEYGRYLPSTKRFPSALKDGRNIGFKALADSIHGMGMKFGIHIMRGVPTEVAKNPSKYKLLGNGDAGAWSRVAQGTVSPCTWLADNAVVQNTAEGQQYYNSIIKLYADWGVDFIKVDDISRPFYTDEIAMIRKAIDACGRPIVLSLSPGKTQYKYAEDCLALANQWRMMDDLWDNWSHVKAVFNEAYEWQDVTRPGNFADCDMLPLGQISMTVGDPGYTNADGGRWTNLTRDEQRTLMTLWGVCHSPLFFGGEMTRNDEFTRSLLTNRDMLDMNAYGVGSRRVSDNGAGEIVWTSVNPATGDRWLALFQSDDSRCERDNPSATSGTTMEFVVEADRNRPVRCDLTQFGYAQEQSVGVYDCWEKKELEPVKGEITAVVPRHGAKLLRLSPQRRDGAKVTVGYKDGKLTADVAGEWDEQSYVQFVVDGRPVPAVKYAGERVTVPFALGAGKHTVVANYSGSARVSGVSSAVVEVMGESGIGEVAAPSSAGNDSVYNLQGVRLKQAPTKGGISRRGR